jgi:hypothetical protein
LSSRHCGYRGLLCFEGTTVDLGCEMELDSEYVKCGFPPGSTGEHR